MLDWIFKYKVRVPGAVNKPAAAPRADKAEAAATPATGIAGATAPSARTKKSKPAAPAVPAAEWDSRLQAALDDDSALLALAQTNGAPLQTKLAAVTALGSESAAKEAERAFRNHDRRVHTLAKQRAQGMRAERETRAKADQLIEAAQALTAVPHIPVNSAVELDHAWLALDAGLLQPQQQQAFAALTAQLSTLTRQRAEQEATLKRWAGDTRRATENLHTLCISAASGNETHHVLADALAHAQALTDAAPAGADGTALWTPLVEARATAQALTARLVLLDRVLMGNPGAEPAAPAQADVPAALAEADAPLAAVSEPEPDPDPQEAAGASAAADPAVTAPSDVEPANPAPQPPPRTVELRPAQQWQQLPPLSDSRLAALLAQRFEAWQREQDSARQEQRAARRTQAKEQQRAVRSERAEALQSALETALAPAEASLAQGLVAETHKHLLAIDELLHAGAPAETLRARINLLQDGYAELRGWQHWAGGRARDDLTQEAVALANSCAPGPDGQLPKLQLKAHAELIDNLRARWRELDALGGASSRTLWQRFDAALKTAYEPLAAQKAAQSAAREQNLVQRQQLLEALEIVALPVVEASDSPAELRPAMAALEQFRVEWRKLGPLEHTVPHKAREPLAARMESALQRLQAPLDAAWQRAQQERQSLIERAQALAAQSQAQTQAQAPAEKPAGNPNAAPPYAGHRGSGVDVVSEVRALQNQWQQCAKALPLPRNAENALWSQFRSALDAVFAARDAVFSARDAEFKAGTDERLALITRLESLGDASAADTQRALAETHAQWQRCGPAPRAQAAALDERFWRAQEAAQRWLAGSQQRSWQARCDALVAKVALCEAQERSAAPAADGTADNTADNTAETAAESAAETAANTKAAAWAALLPLPDAWETALQQRAGLTAVTSPHSKLSFDAVLLQLEAAWNLPSPPERAAARRDLQLQAMKAALETRRASAAGAGAAATTPEGWLAEALRRPPQDKEQRERLQAVLTALREQGPAGTGTPTPARTPAQKTQRTR